MKFTVIWQRHPEQRLAELWIDAPDRQDVANAADEVDSLLAHDPLSVGESREGELTNSLRISFGRDLQR